jgi:aspartate/methionine/tyrosine aminotransferase
MKIDEFGVELWMNEFENDCAFNLAETCVASLTVGELLEICEHPESFMEDLLSMKMTYGAINGSDRLRDAITGLYAGQNRDNIVVTHGTIGANALVHETLVEPGDRVISVLPTYQQHYSIPKSYGADVQVLNLKPENAFLPDLAELRDLVKPGTKLIALNNPNNPTGSLMNREFLLQIADIAREVGAYVLSDEVYRGSDQDGNGFTASIADLYEKGISTAGMSKTFSLAGLRLGWIAARQDVIQAVCVHRDYNTISVGKVNDYLATMALEHRDKILARTQKMTRENRVILDNWITHEPLVSYIKPRSGTTALLRYDVDMPSREFCIRLLHETGVLLTPGSAMDMEGWLRIGYANDPQILRDGLVRLSAFLATLQSESQRHARMTTGSDHRQPQLN